MNGIVNKSFKGKLPHPLEYITFTDYYGYIKAGFHHSHHSFKLLYILSGQFGFSFKTGEKCILSAGDCCLIAPETEHLWFSDDPTLCKTLMFFFAPLTEEFAGDISSYYNPFLKHYWKKEPFNNQHLQPMFDVLRKELDSEKTGSNSMILAVSLQLLTHFYQCTNPDTARMSTALPQPLVKALTFIEKEYMNPISISGLAQIACLSVSRFSELFRKHLQQSPIQYLLQLRLKKAELLLMHSDLRVTEIAERCGFADAQGFCRQFKKSMNSSPLEYRNRKNCQ